MLGPRIRLTDSHRDDLAVACELGPIVLEQLARRIDSAEFTIRRSQIEKIIDREIGPEKGAVLARILFGIGSTFRRAFLSAEDALEGVTQSLGDALTEDTRFRNWDRCRVGLRRLLETQSLTLAAKALDISYDFERVYLAGRILTSIRPVFDDQREVIKGSTIVQTLRLEFLAPNGDQSSISVAMDVEDIQRLKEECERAENKAQAAKLKIEHDCGIEAMIPGEEQHE